LAKTITVVRRSVFGNMRVRIVEVDVTSYTALGEPLTAAELGLSAVEHAEASSNENHYAAWYDIAGAKLRIWAGASAEIAGTTDAGKFRILAIGK